MTSTMVPHDFVSFFGIFRQNPLKVPVEKRNVKQNFATHELLHKWLLRFSVRRFFPVYRSLFVSYMIDIFCICIHICKKYFFPLLLFLFLRWKAKEKLALECHFPLDLINLFNTVLFNKSF